MLARPLKGKWKLENGKFCSCNKGIESLEKKTGSKNALLDLSNEN